MRKFFWQRWALMLLLVTRLVIGELGYAMPAVHSDSGGFTHSSMAAEMSSDATDSSGHEAMSASHHAGHSTGDDASAESDCCKSGKCQCVCLHVPCLAWEPLALNLFTTTLLRTPQGLENFISQRPSGLFRPPARIS